MAKEIRLTFRVETPAFLHRMPDEAAELRAMSFKGALRYWVRAVLWRRFRNIVKVRHFEQALMGSTARASRVGVRMRVLSLGHDRLEKHRNSNDDVGLAYLAGPGLHQYNNCWTADYLPGGTVFQVDLMLRWLSPEEGDVLKEAIRAFTLFGGLGSRSRRGFGSCTLIESDGIDWTFPDDVNALKEALARFHGECWDTESSWEPSHLPPYPAFSPHGYVGWCAGEPGTAPIRMLEALGRTMLRFRSNGRGGRLFDGKPASNRFLRDKITVQQFLQGGQAAGLPERLVFGLPHHYFFSREKKVQINLVTKTSDGVRKKRRASPLFLSIHRLSCGATVAVGLLLPARFLREGDQIQYETGRGEERKQFLTGDVSWRSLQFWQPAIEFLDEMKKGLEID